MIDMGQATQAAANSLRPYDLVKNQHIPRRLGDHPNKAVFGADFSAGGKSNSGGSFMIEPQYASVAASTVALSDLDAKSPSSSTAD